MQVRLDGKSALVTGSSSGIGRGIAVALAAAGADVTVVYRTGQAMAEETAAEIRSSGRRANIVQADVSDPASVDRLFAAHDDAFNGIDMLVNNAGIARHGFLHEIAIEQWDEMLKTNLFGPFYCSRLAARKLIEQQRGGRIVNISSVHEEACTAGDAGYAVSKGGLRNLTRTMASELGPFGITVNDVAPGMIATHGMNRRARDDTAYAEASAQQIVSRRVGMPEDVAAMVVFLCSDGASYCTGSTFFVDGGWMLTWPPV